MAINEIGYGHIISREGDYILSETEYYSSESVRKGWALAKKIGNYEFQYIAEYDDEVEAHHQLYKHAGV